MQADADLELHACMTPNVLKVMFMLAETELDYRLKHVRIYRGENFGEGFDQLHPYRKLPVLVDRCGPSGEPHRVFESGAILIYLAERTGRFIGTDAAQRSTVTQWLMLQMSSVGPIFGQATHFNRAVPDQDYARRRFVTQGVRLCQLYDERLAQVPFVAGDDFSIADMATFPWLWRHPGMVGIDVAPYRHLRRWLDEVSSRPSFARAHALYKTLVDADRADLASADPGTIDRLLGRGDWFLVD
ncbi:MAG TPA: glutathione binding-like protein [Novosphingobium sp.]|nr:glutathione binding-like protein [Novosphingobium sp.]